MVMDCSAVAVRFSCSSSAFSETVKLTERRRDRAKTFSEQDRCMEGEPLGTAIPMPGACSGVRTRRSKLALGGADFGDIAERTNACALLRPVGSARPEPAVMSDTRIWP